MLEHFGVTEANWREAAKKDPNFEESETAAVFPDGAVVCAGPPDPHICEEVGAGVQLMGAGPTSYGFLRRRRQENPTGAATRKRNMVM